MAEKPPTPRAEQPRAEPEIIPPGAPLRSGRFDGFAGPHFSQRIYVAKFGPLGIVLVALAIVAIVTVLLVVLLGALLFWIPVIGVIVAAAIVLRFLKSPWRRGP
jgi:hypothetical protein